MMTAMKENKTTTLPGLRVSAEHARRLHAVEQKVKEKGLDVYDIQHCRSILGDISEKEVMRRLRQTAQKLSLLAPR